MHMHQTLARKLTQVIDYTSYTVIDYLTSFHYYLVWLRQFYSPSLQIRGECYTFPKYIVYLSEAEGVYSCKGWTGDYRPSINHWNTTTTCDLPCDRAYNWTLVVVEADSGEVVYSKGHQFCECVAD